MVIVETEIQQELLFYSSTIKPLFRSLNLVSMFVLMSD